MKNKFIAILLSLVMIFACMVTFAGCNELGSENGGTNSGNVGDNGSGGGTGGTGGTDEGGDEEGKGEDNPTPPKTTVDSFDEWYQALLDTLTAENYTVKTDFSDGYQHISHDIINEERNGDIIYLVCDKNNKCVTGEIYCELTDTSMIMYTHNFYKYDQTKEYWYKVENEFMKCDDEFVETLINNLAFGPIHDELGAALFALLYGYDVMDYSTELSEAGMKASALSIYQNAVYNQETSEYTSEFPNTSAKTTITLKFENGKISYLKFNEEHTDYIVELVYNFTYGDAAPLTIPEEVKESAALTETLQNIATALAGTYIYEKNSDKYELDFDYDSFSLLNSIGGMYDSGKMSGMGFSWEIISADTIIVVFVDDTTAEFKIGENCIIYTDENGTEYTFTKTEQE